MQDTATIWILTVAIAYADNTTKTGSVIYDQSGLRYESDDNLTARAAVKLVAQNSAAFRAFIAYLKTQSALSTLTSVSASTSTTIADTAFRFSVVGTTTSYTYVAGSNADLAASVLSDNISNVATLLAAVGFITEYNAAVA